MQHVKAHTEDGIDINEAVDELAKLGLDKQIQALQEAGAKREIVPEPYGRDSYKADLKKKVQEERLESIQDMAEWSMVNPNGEIEVISHQCEHYWEATDKGRINRIYCEDTPREFATHIHRQQCGIVPSLNSYESCPRLFQDGQTCPFCGCGRKYRPSQMVKHIIYDCTHFEKERRIL